MKTVRKEYADKPSLEIAKKISQIALDKKAEDLLVLDVREISGFTDYFVIMSGRSTRHVQGLSAAIDKEMSSKRMKSASTEGLEEGQWVLFDFNDVIVHIFYSEVRKFYDLEGLWHDAPRIEVE
jgi:ribosome-associated protein